MTPPDLADRAVFLSLSRSLRNPPARGGIVGGVRGRTPAHPGVLLDAVVRGLKMLPRTRLEKLPRMADFALWAAACESALWPAGTFWSAYAENRDDTVVGVIDADPIAAAVRAIMTVRAAWTGTASTFWAPWPRP